MRPLSRIKSQCGYILLPVVLLLGLLALVAFLLGYEGGIGRYLTLQRAEPEQALYVAEAGLQYATWQVQQANCINYTDVPATPFGNGSFTATITPHFGSPVDITATGSLAGGASRSLVKNVPALELPITEVLQPDGAVLEDTWIYQWKKTWNYGVDTTIQMDTEFSDSIMRSLIKFDLSSYASSVKILGATLELYQMSPSVNGGPVGVHRMTTPWDEGTNSGGVGPGATWNESANGVPWTALGGDGDFAPEPVTVTNVPMGAIGWYAWDITTLVSDWVSGSAPNHGFMLRMQQTGKSAYFYSSDYSNTALRPKLTITYACECGSETSQSLVLQPGAEGLDSYVQNKANDGEHGLEEDLFMDSAFGTNNAHHVLLGFDISSLPSGVLINSAELELYAYDVDTNVGGTDVTAHRLLEPWVEAEVTYQDADAATPWTWPANFEAVPEASAAFLKDNLGWHTWNITDLVIKWSTGVYPNNGLVLLGTSDLYWTSFYSSEYSDPALHPKLTVNYTCPCGVECTSSPPIVLPNVLFVVGDATSLASKDAGRKTLMESWGYNVTLIDDGDSQANFDSAAAAADVVYVSGTIGGGTLADKLTGSPTSIVNEFNGKLDNFGFCSNTSMSVPSADTFTKTDPAHFITEPFSGNPVTVFTTAISMVIPFGTLAPDLQNVGEYSGLPALVTLDTGATRFDGNPAPARRVHLPYSSAETVNLTGDGETILQRALRWAGGEGTGSGGGSQTLTLAAGADTWIEQATDVNYGADGWSQTGKDVGQNLRRSMIKFDVSGIPAGATVVSATLRLYVVNKLGNQDSNVGMYFIVTDWEENIVTWISSGGGGYDPTSLAEPLIEWTTGWKEWDVPPGLIHEWIDTVTPNHGLLLDFLGTKKNHILRFVTKEYADLTLHPQLVIEYTEP